MKYSLIFLLVLLIACGKKDNLELEVVTKEINSLNIKPDDFYKYYNDSIINSKAKTIVVYKLTNNSNKTYYFNLDGYNKDLSKNAIRMDRAYVRFTDSENYFVKTVSSSPTLTPGTTLPNNLMLVKVLNYNFTTKQKNFIIHPNETLYFEWVLVLPYGNRYEYTSYFVKNFNAQNKYFAELLLSSNGVNYKTQISRTDLKTIQENGYEVFNGTLKSKNKIPIVFN